MPDMQTTLVRGHLQNVSLMYHNAELVNQKVFPLLDMPTSKAKITIYNKGDQYRDEVPARARGTEAAIADWKLSTVDVDTVEYGVKHRITDQDLRDAGLEGVISPPVNLVQDALERNARKLELRREVAVAAAVFAGTWADANAGGEDAAGLWAPPGATNTFLDDMDLAMSTLQKNGVALTNLRLMVDYATMQKLKRVDAIRDQLKYTSNQSLSESSLAALLGIREVVVAKAIKSSAKEKRDGTDFTGVNIWEKNATKGSAFLYHFPDAPGLKTLSAGYQPRNKMPNGQYRESFFYRRPELKAWEYESGEDVGIKITAASAGYLWNDTILT
ncbi:MAG: hypothetical protein ABIW76_14430 [Fibrobacteria bacterium]